MEMALSKDDSKMLKGVAILSMLMLHLFCRTDNLPYTPVLWIGSIPLIYYFGLFGDICVSIYCFISGYAHYYQSSCLVKTRDRYLHLLRFFIVFWIIALLVALYGIVVQHPTIRYSGWELLLNCLIVKNSYNGAWWYANTYLVLVILQPLSYRFAKKYPVWIVLASAFIFYTIGYGIRFWGWGANDIPIISWVITHVGLFGTSYFPYMIGMIFCKTNIIGVLRKQIANCKLQHKNICMNILTVAGFASLIIAHGIVRALFVAVITATTSICLLCICKMPDYLTKLFTYLGKHSTNIWLTHMFFYMEPFDGLVFYARYPILILLMLRLLSLIASYIINWISKPILNRVR